MHMGASVACTAARLPDTDFATSHHVSPLLLGAVPLACRYLQDAPLELVVWDKDVYTTDDVIGVVYIDASNLLLRASGDPSRVAMLEGWFPIFDTLEGSRGELYVEVRPTPLPMPCCVARCRACHEPHIALSLVARCCESHGH